MIPDVLKPIITSYLELDERKSTLIYGTPIFSNCLNTINNNYPYLYNLNLSNQSLKKLQIPENIKFLKCDYNLLTNLTLNDSLRKLNCSFNFLTEIICNKSLRELLCFNNKDMNC